VNTRAFVPSLPVHPEPVEPKASEHPFVLSLSKDTYRREARFDRLTTNGPYPQTGSMPVSGFDTRKLGLASPPPLL